MSARAAAARLVYESSLVDPAAPSNLSQSTRPVEAPKFGSDDGQGLREHMIKEWKYGRMTSEAVCTLSWHISRAGGSGVADLALNPKLTKQAEHLRKALEVKSKDSFYLARIPLWDKADEDRKYFDFPMYLPHDAFGKNFNRSPESFDPALNDESFLPRSYFTHELYLSKKGKACPIGYFSDAVPHTNRDSFFSFYWSSIFSGERFLICSLRKQDLCQCGCRGFCTLSAVMRTIAWSFNQLAAGTYPEIRDDGLPFAAGSMGEWLAGSLIADGKCGALVELRADLLEIIGALGFAQSWSVKTSPCFLCEVAYEDLYDFPANMQHHDWPLRDAEVYDRKAKAAVIEVEVPSDDLLKKLDSMLKFDHRKRDSWGPGKVLFEPMEELGLPAGARLMESDEVRDIHQLKSLTTPITLRFFDSQGDHGLTFISPLFDIVGFNIESIALDVMHVMDLGVSQYLVGSVFRQLIESNFCNSTHRHVDARRFENLKALRRRLQTYYGTLDRARGTMSAIGRLTFPMIGELKWPKLKSKAAECRNLVPLTVLLHNEFPDHLRSVHLRICCISLDKFYKLMKNETRLLGPTSLRQLQSHMSSFLHNWKAYGGHFVFKHHAA